MKYHIRHTVYDENGFQVGYVDEPVDAASVVPVERSNYVPCRPTPGPLAYPHEGDQE